MRTANRYCVSCGKPGAVVSDSRNTRAGGARGQNIFSLKRVEGLHDIARAVRRRRCVCNECGHRWTTYELTEKEIGHIFAVSGRYRNLLGDMQKAFKVLAGVLDE